MSREMLVNVSEQEECRVAVVSDGNLEELYTERTSWISHVGNIYKGKVTNIEASIQAAFIDFGIGKNGFLHVSDLHPRYFPAQDGKKTERVGKRQSLNSRLPIQKCLRKGQEVMVQVTKEGVNTKGPTLSTYISLPGKYLVMMPWMKKHGVSHKIDDEAERDRLRKLLEEIDRPSDLGFIIRTAGQGCSKREIQSDMKYLCRLWKAIDKRGKTDKSPRELYKESDLVIRTLRDIFRSDINKIICDSESNVKRIRDFLAITMPRYKKRVQLYQGQQPLFHEYNIEKEIEKVQSRTVELVGGGSIVIEQTEALVAVDVNSGSYRQKKDAELTAFDININAAGEIAKQLRLRDLGGLIICDFIDMRSAKHRAEVEKKFKDALKADRARCKVLRISSFGVIEMTRQRMRPSLQLSTYISCPHCGGSGFVKSHESMAIEIIRMLNLSSSKKAIKKIEIFVSEEVADYLHNAKRGSIVAFEEANAKEVLIHGSSEYRGERHNVICYNDRGSVVKLN
ncbi:MAG: Rne/Rng family ribonuclease [Phycisphaerae bacterium]|nr:Rne/Rng family ribonuclease [Phycisphaerae bacterium]